MITMICEGCGETYLCKTSDGYDMRKFGFIPAPQYTPPRVDGITLQSWTSFLHWAEMHNNQGCRP